MNFSHVRNIYMYKDRLLRYNFVMFHDDSWNNLFDFCKKLDKFSKGNRALKRMEGRFLKLAVYFFGIRLFVWTFASEKQKVMKKSALYSFAMLSVVMAGSCENLDDDPGMHVDETTYAGLEEVAEILSLIPMQSIHLQEVHTAVTSSSGNGYDEEYTMRDLFWTPGAGVGDEPTKVGTAYGEPLRDLIEDYVRSGCVTKSGDATIKEPDEFLDALIESDIQIYWPFSEKWDGETLPIITFDPEDGSEVNIGYKLVYGDDGFRHVQEIVVDEEMAEEMPVWVVNRNSDAGFTSLELLRREDPEWGEGGGNIIVRPSDKPETRSDSPMKCLVLKDFTAKRNYDSWFAGASEFFVKIGYIDDFTAATEAELKLYNPRITDFMIVVKRNQVGIPQNFNAILMTNWYEHEDVEDACALMIIEDDGGTREEWSTKAKVYVAGKSYGIEVSIPFNVRDDIVWRGMLACKWLEKCSVEPGHFGDVDLTFELIDY